MIKNDQDNSAEYETVLDLLNMGLPIEEIMAITRLSKEEILRIQDGETK